MNLSKLLSALNANRWIGWALLLTMLGVGAVTYTASSISTSRQIGRLSATPSYDDVAYFGLASKYYFDMRPKRTISKPFAREVLKFFKSYTHSPVTVALAIIGFFIFGFGYVKVYYMLSLVVFAYLAFVVLICRRLPFPYLASVALASLGIPFATMASIEFRPDQLWTILITGSSVWILVERRMFSTMLPSAAFGVMMGVALLTKSSTFAMTFVVCCGSWLLAAIIAFKGRGEGLTQIGRGLLVTVSCLVATAGWYCIPHSGKIWEYFYSNCFGIYKDVWVFQGSLADRMFYYLGGVPAQSNLGLFFLPLLALYLGGTLRDAIRPATREDRIRGIAFLWMLLCLYLVNGVPSVKSPFLGGSLYGFLIFGGLWNFSRFLRWCWEADEGKERLLQLRLRGLTSLAVVATAAAAYQFPDLCKWNPVSAAEFSAINRGIVKDILPESRAVPITLVLAQASPVITEYIEMEFLRRRRRLEMRSLAMHDDFQVFKDASESADFVILQDPGTPGSPGYSIPSEKLLPQLLEHFQSASDWGLAREYPVAGGKKVYLFMNTEAKNKATQ